MDEMTPQRIALIAVVALVVLTIGWRSMGHDGSPQASYAATAPQRRRPWPRRSWWWSTWSAPCGSRACYRLPDGARVLDAVHQARPARPRRPGRR